MSRKKDAEHLLYAMTDVDDHYIEEASRYYSSRRKASAHRVLVFRRAAGIAAALAACLTIVLILGQNGALLRRSGSTSSGSTPVQTESAVDNTTDSDSQADAKSAAEQTESGAPAGAAQDTGAGSAYDSVNSTADQAMEESVIDEAAPEAAAAGNPWQEVGSLEDAASLTGFTLIVPAAQDDYPATTVYVMDQSMIEVDYSTEDGSETGYSIRKAEGSDDISGDYNEYTATQIKEIGGMEITLKGDGQTWSVATWTAADYTYAIDAQEHPLTEEQITELVSGTQ